MPMRDDHANATAGYSAAHGLLRIGRLCVDGKSSITVGDMADALGRTAIGMLLLVLTLPSLIPVPGPFGLVFGTLIAFLAIQIILGARRLWLPDAVRRRSLSPAAVDAIVSHGTPLLARVEGWLKPRRLLALTSLRGRILTGVPILLMAIALALPIPFGNALPAAALIAFALGFTARDGMAILAGLGLSVAAIAWMAVLLTAGSEVLRYATGVWASL